MLLNNVAVKIPDTLVDNGRTYTKYEDSTICL